MPSVEVWLSAWSVVKIHLSEVKRCDASVCASVQLCTHAPSKNMFSAIFLAGAPAQLWFDGISFPETVLFAPMMLPEDIVLPFKTKDP